MTLAAGPGVAVREFRMASGHGFADYLLFVNGKAVGVVRHRSEGCVERDACRACDVVG